MSDPFPSPRSSQTQFGQVAAAYGTSQTFINDANLVSLESFVRGSTYRTAVDIGTGAGFTAFAIAPYARRIIATDVTPQMLEQTRSLRSGYEAPQTELALAAAEALPFTDGSIDLVTCRTAAHHFIDVSQWLAEVRRVLSPGGLLVNADTVAPEDPKTAAWMHDIETRRDQSHVRNLAPSKWRSAVERAGLRVTDSILSKVQLECEDWGRRAGMTPDAVEVLRQDFLNAPPAVKEAFGIREHESGEVRFHWDVLVLRAEKVR